MAEMAFSEVARRLEISPSTLRRWVRDGLVPLRDGTWPPSALAHARIVARLRARGYTLEAVREASRRGRLAYGYMEDLFPQPEGGYTLQEAAEATGLEPLARIVGRGTFAVDPDIFGIAPVEAANRALAQAGFGWDDVDVVELNEAFASQSLACLREWKELDPDKVNPDGGAIALGHPLGASGVRILGTLAHALRRRGGGRGVAAICIGVGQGLAVALEA
jgi:hypothetical protein